MALMTPGLGSGVKPAGATAGASKPSILGQKQEPELPKCFGTDYFGKWNMTGMTLESMKIDRPEYQTRCAHCYYFERCYFCNHIRLLRIKH